MSKILRSQCVPLAQRFAAAFRSLARRFATAFVALARRFAAAFISLARRSATARVAWLVLACAAAHGCKEECPPHTVQSGKLCVFKHDGGEAVAAVGGSGANLIDSGWSCSNVGLACVCRQDMTHGNGCSTLPPCCFTATDAGVNVCECWPSNSSECMSAQTGQRSGAAIVASCPPR